eukprot:3186238-Prymnesium_polylepis.1
MPLHNFRVGWHASFFLPRIGRLQSCADSEHIARSHPRIRKAILRRMHHLMRLWHRAGGRYKVKAAVGFHQCIAAVQSVYHVAAPAGLLEKYTGWLHVLEFDFNINAFVPDAWLRVVPQAVSSRLVLADCTSNHRHHRVRGVGACTIPTRHAMVASICMRRVVGATLARVLYLLVEHYCVLVGRKVKHTPVTKPYRTHR